MHEYSWLWNIPQVITISHKWSLKDVTPGCIINNEIIAPGLCNTHDPSGFDSFGKSCTFSFLILRNTRAKTHPTSLAQFNILGCFLVPKHIMLTLQPAMCTFDFAGRIHLFTCVVAYALLFQYTYCAICLPSIKVCWQYHSMLPHSLQSQQCRCSVLLTGSEEASLILHR